MAGIGKGSEEVQLLINWQERLAGTTDAASGKLQSVAKDDVRLLLGRSPDRADAVIQGICGEDSVDFSRVNIGGPVAF